jgi:hypothetical protein
MASSVYLRSVSAGSRGEHEPQASGPEGNPQWSSDQGEGEQESDEHQGPTHENTEPPDPLRAGLDLEPRWTEHSELERTRVIESPDVTHLRFRVVKQTPSVPLRARPWADVEAFVRVSFASVPIGNTWRGRLVGCPWQTKRTKTKRRRR